MTVFNQRNALVGYATLKALKLRRRTKRRKAPKIALYLGLGLVSAGILAAVVGVLMHRRRSEPEAQFQGYAVGEETEDNTDDEPLASSEPIPAT